MRRGASLIKVIQERSLCDGSPTETAGAGILSSGKACSLAGMNHRESIAWHRKIPRHHLDEDLDQDKSLCYGRSVTPRCSSILLVA
nr:UPF0175 family protein [Methanofollis tationis]